MSGEWISRVGNFIKAHLLFVSMLIILSWTLYPAFFLPFPDESYVESTGVIDTFGNHSNHLKLTNVPLNFYFSQYGTHILGNMLAYIFFEFNSFAYFALNISLRILAAVSIYCFVSKWSKSKIAGFIAGTYFGVSYPGIQNTTRVTLFMVYLAIIFMFIFLDRWWKFHNDPNFKNARSSVLFLILSILIYPVRMIGMAILLVVGEAYWLLSKYKDKTKRAIRVKHLIIAFATLVILIYITGTLKPTPEIQFKMVSPKILFLALLTGYPPVITSLWLFISNLIVSPTLFQKGYLSLIIMQTYTIILPIAGIVFLFNCLIKRKFLFAFASITIVTFPLLVSGSTRNLTGWNSSWIVSTQFGGTIFLLCTLIIFYMWNQKRELAQMGFLGIFLALSNLLVPWMLAPVKYADVQSIFDFSLRYYTLPSIGIAIVFGSIFSFFIESLSQNISLIIPSLRSPYKILRTAKKIIYSILLLPFPLLILAIIYLQSLLVHNLLLSGSQNIDTGKIDIFWNKIKNSFSIPQDSDTTKIVYIKNDSNLNENYIKDLFPVRFSIYWGATLKLPKFNFVFDKNEALKLAKNIDSNLTKDSEFYAFRFDGNRVFDITEEFLKTSQVQ